MIGKNEEVKQRPTDTRGGRDVPEIDEGTIITSVKGFLNNYLKVDVVQRKLETKYDIVPDNDNLWPIDDAKRAWGKMQRMSDKNKLPYALIILSQVTRKQKAAQKAETERYCHEEKEKYEELSRELSKLKAEKAETDRQLLVEKNKVRALAEDVRSRKAEKLILTQAARSGKGMNVSDNMTLPGETLYPFYEMREAAQTATRKMLQSAMAPHTDSDVCEDSDDEMDLDGGPARLRPLTTRHAGGNVVYSYKPAKPQDIDLWSKDMQHPRKSGMEAWSKINRLRNIYRLHPLDGVAMMCTVLNASEANKIRRVVESGLGDSQQKIDEGWQALREFIQSSTNASTDWAKIAACKQKINEAVDDFSQRFIETFLRHSGMSGLTEENIGTSDNGALKANLLHSLNPEVKQAVKLTTPTWEDTTFTLEMLINVARRVERGVEQKLRCVNTWDSDLEQECMLRLLNAQGPRKAPEHQHYRSQYAPRNRSYDTCHKCGKHGHWANQCNTQGRGRYTPRLNHHKEGDKESDDDENIFSRFAKLTDHQRQTIMSAVPGN